MERTKSATMERQARLESMKIMMPGASRGQGRNSFVFRRHQDFSRECQRKVYMYAKETRYLVSKIDRFQKEVMEKQRELEVVDAVGCRGNANPPPSNRHHVEVPPPKLNKEKKDVLLFRVRHRAGEKVYLREHETIASLQIKAKASLKHHNKMNHNKVR